MHTQEVDYDQETTAESIGSAHAWAYDLGAFWAQQYLDGGLVERTELRRQIRRITGGLSTPTELGFLRGFLDRYEGFRPVPKCVLKALGLTSTSNS